MTEEYDVIIKDAHIIDGSGKKAYKGSIGVKGDKIAALGEVKGDSVKTVDAKGLYASPGWIDAHSHGDSTLLFFPKAESYIMQGVTSFVGGRTACSPRSRSTRSWTSTSAGQLTGSRLAAGSRRWRRSASR